MDLMKQAFLVLHYEGYQETTFYLRTNKYTGKVGVVCNNPHLGGSRYVLADMDYYVYELPKLEFSWRDFAVKELLDMPVEERLQAMLFVDVEITVEEFLGYGSSKDYSNEVFYEYFIAHSPEYRQVIEEVVKLLRKRVQLPRNLLSAEYAREYDVRIRRVLGV